jgi:hypothetical protein
MGVAWLRERVPEFRELAADELEAIIDFSLLWTLFEARILNLNANAQKIIEAITLWEEAGRLNEQAYLGTLEYFRQRYLRNGVVTEYFNGLNLRPNDHPDLVKRTLCNANAPTKDKITTVFIIILRYRNNLFHGLKWQYGLRNQKENFKHANLALMTALEQHARL